MTDQEYSEFIKKHVYLNEDTLEMLKRGEITMPTFSPFFESDSGPVPPKDSVISNNSSFGKVGIDPKYNLLTEAYIKTPKPKCTEYFYKIKDLLQGHISKEDFDKYCDNEKIGFQVIEGTGLLGGFFSIESAIIIIQMSKDTIVDLLVANDSKIKSMSENFWMNFVHEDTHQQQFNKSHLSFKNYEPSTIQYWDEDFDENFGYFNQSTEADAYGREIGARLFVYYKNFKNTTSVKSIFKDIINNNIDDPYSKKIINAYKDPRIERSNMKKFYRPMYDFLENNEKSKERYIEK